VTLADELERPRVEDAGPRPTAAGEHRRGLPVSGRVVGLLAALAVLLLMVVLSLAVGTVRIPLSTVVGELLHYDPASNAGQIIQSLRLPRTLNGLAVGACLGLAGALMQSLTRNPLADPGLLGVSTGSSAAVVFAIGVPGWTNPLVFVWFAFAGAAIVSVAVYLLGGTGRFASSPMRLVLAGAALSAALGSWTGAVTLLRPDVFQDIRFWSIGALTGQSAGTLAQLAPFMLAGAVIAFLLPGSLNAFALGEDTGRALGARLATTRVLSMIAITLLVGAATAAAGPIGFIGLTVPYAARAIAGPDMRWVLPFSLLLAPALLLGADVLGRVIAGSGEIDVGIMTAAIGGPFFIVLVSTRRIARL
jgi:iron complex transport system permease protein